MSPQEIKSKRLAAGVSGSAVCQIAKMGRTRLSDIERGYGTPTAEELTRISEAIDQIVTSRAQLARLAAESGLSLAGLRL